MDVDFNVINYYPSVINLCKCFCLFKNNYKDLSQIKEKTYKLLKIWRLATYRLMDRKVFEHNPVRVQYLRNCPPSLGQLNIDQTFRLCKFYSCPWCWSRRYGVKTFKKLKDHITANTDTRFYYFTKESKYIKKNYANSPVLFKTQCFDAVTLCRKLTRRNSVLGGMCFTFLEPQDSGFKIVTRLLVSSKKRIDVAGFTTQYETIDPLRLAYRFGSYPYNLIRPTLNLKGLAYFIKNKNKAIKSSIFFGNLINRRRS